MGIAHTNGKVCLLGGPLDGQTYGDIPIFDDGMAGTKLSIPLSQPAAEAMHAQYQRRDDEAVDGVWYFLYTHTTDPEGQSEQAQPGQGGREIAMRFRQQQSWWMASELARRHPELRVSRVMLPHGPCLIASHGAHGHRIQIDPTHGIQYVQLGVVRAVPWSQVFAQANPHAVLRQLERDADGFAEPTDTPATTATALTYRVIARIMAMTIDDRWTWQAIPLELISGATVMPAATREILQGFPTGRAAAARYVEVIGQIAQQVDPAHPRHWHEPLWLLRRDREPVAVLDEEGVAHLPRGVRLDLTALYPQFAHRTELLAALVLLKPDLAAAATLMHPEKV